MAYNGNYALLNSQFAYSLTDKCFIYVTYITSEARLWVLLPQLFTLLGVV